jgi:hypothetical protein
MYTNKHFRNSFFIVTRPSNFGRLYFHVLILGVCILLRVWDPGDGGGYIPSYHLVHFHATESHLNERC